jgi:hypothetical protein
MIDAVAKVVETLAENRRLFEAFCMSLSDDEAMRAVPGSTWVVKDFASHLATLDVLFERYTASIVEGGAIDMRQDADGSAFNLDAWNDAQVAERRGWTMARIFEEAATNRASLIGAMGRLSDGDLARPMHFSDSKRGEADFPLGLFLTGWAQHDPIHAADMLKALPERAADAELQAWVSNPFVTGYQKAMSV